MNLNILAYVIYFAIMAFVIGRVGWLFYHHGQVYVDRLFQQDLNYGRWLNKLLLKGYYLFNLGYVALSIESWAEVCTKTALIEQVASEVGLILLILAILHYINILWLQYYSRWKSRHILIQNIYESKNQEIMEANNTVLAYIIYLPIVIVLTYYVARTLFKNGRVFMLDIFRGREEIAFATNRLFELGFYLVNIGFALSIMEIDFYGDYFGKQELMEILSQKLGGFSIYLGVMLFLNLYMFFRGKSKSKEERQLQAVPLPNAE